MKRIFLLCTLLAACGQQDNVSDSLEQGIGGGCNTDYALDWASLGTFTGKAVYTVASGNWTGEVMYDWGNSNYTFSRTSCNVVKTGIGGGGGTNGVVVNTSGDYTGTINATSSNVYSQIDMAGGTIYGECNATNFAITSWGSVTMTYGQNNCPTGSQQYKLVATALGHADIVGTNCPDNGLMGTNVPLNVVWTARGECSAPNQEYVCGKVCHTTNSCCSPTSWNLIYFSSSSTCSGAPACTPDPPPGYGSCSC